MRRLRRDIGERSHKVFWDKENMCPGFGQNIAECEHFRILKDNVRRNLTITNPMKNRSFFHEKYDHRTRNNQKRYCNNG